MTTPAVSVSYRHTPAIDFGYTADCSGNTYPYTVDWMTGWFVEQRPESHNSPKDESGWRNPTDWDHFKFNSITAPDGHAVNTYSNRCGPNMDLVDQTINELDVSDGVSRIINAAIGGDLTLPDRALTKAYLKLKNQDVNLAVAFAERKETANLFVHAATDIARQVKRFKGSHFKDFLKAAAVEGTHRWRETPKRWLEMQYGWKPLMSDVSGACSAMSKREKSANAFRVKVTGTAKSSDQFIAYAIDPDRMAQELTGIIDYEYTARLWYVLASPSLVPFVQLGLTNPAELIWERVGFSFVVDWFLPVGNWLSTLDADWGWNYLTGAGTLFARVKSSAKNQDGQGPGEYHSNHYKNARVDGISMRRQVFPEPPGVGLPHFKNPFSSVHVANAMSLLASAFRR